MIWRLLRCLVVVMVFFNATTAVAVHEMRFGGWHIAWCVAGVASIIVATNIIRLVWRHG